MTNYKEIFNELTGESEFEFNATLKEIGTTVLQNSNEKDYIIVTLQFHLPDGDEVERTAICYASNYEKGIEIGKDYLCNLSFDEKGNPQIRMSHLTNAKRANLSDFEGLLQKKKQLIDEELVM